MVFVYIFIFIYISIVFCIQYKLIIEFKLIINKLKKIIGLECVNKIYKNYTRGKIKNVSIVNL